MSPRSAWRDDKTCNGLSRAVQVAVKAVRGQNSGKCDVFLDDQHQGSVDTSRMYSQSCVIFRSQALEHGR